MQDDVWVPGSQAGQCRPSASVSPPPQELTYTGIDSTYPRIPSSCKRANEKNTHSSQRRKAAQAYPPQIAAARYTSLHSSSLPAKWLKTTHSVLQALKRFLSVVSHGKASALVGASLYAFMVFHSELSWTVAATRATLTPSSGNTYAGPSPSISPPNPLTHKEFLLSIRRGGITIYWYMNITQQRVNHKIQCNNDMARNRLKYILYIYYIQLEELMIELVMF